MKTVNNAFTDIRVSIQEPIIYNCSVYFNNIVWNSLVTPVQRYFLMPGFLLFKMGLIKSCEKLNESGQ